ncbi:phospholipase [Serratia marcescens]|uniref:phospholipase n=1 Tax=Serratia marcescens TaxID=615 RepID=UPI0009282EF0|nr:phospholipase [Serratia marcescens]OJH81900.1 phospholipase A1 [Serratia marcescens]
MFHRMKLLYIDRDLISPDEFPQILNPTIAAHDISNTPEKDVLSMFSGFHGNDRIRREAGVSHHGISSNLRGIVQDGLRRGEIVAIDTQPGVFATIGPFYADNEGFLRLQGSTLIGFQASHIIWRYEEVVKSYGGRRAKPTIFPTQVTRAKPGIVAAAATAIAGAMQAKVPPQLTKAQRWQERQYLIGRGQRSIYPDARIAADRLAQNNVAVEKAKLAENVYKNTNPLKDTPGVPEGWKDISNDDGTLSKMGLNKKMLFDNKESPNFLARVYQPDSGVFGKDMNPTVAFRGSRAPEFAEGTRETVNKFLWKDVSAIKDIKVNNIEDWTNNGAQAFGADSEYYKSAVEIGTRLKNTSGIDISGHSLGGGMASAASMASGRPAWTFNAAGLNAGTVEKYGGSVIGLAKGIQAYRVDGELLTKLQEVDVWQDAKDVYFNPAALAYKELGSSLAPNAAGIPHTLSGGTGSMLDKHGIDQAIKLIEDEKDDDIATIRGRL